MKLKEFLNQSDRFAANVGARLTEVEEGRAVAEMTVTKEHLNAESTISFLHSAVEGDVLTAEAVETLNHPKVPYLEVKVRNQRGELVCAFTGMAYRKDKDFNFG